MSGSEKLYGPYDDAMLSGAVQHVLKRIATHIEDPKLFDFEATHEELREFHKSGMQCSFASWKVAKLLRDVAAGLREIR